MCHTEKKSEQGCLLVVWRWPPRVRPSVDIAVQEEATLEQQVPGTLKKERQRQKHVMAPSDGRLVRGWLLLTAEELDIGTGGPVVKR